MLASRFLKPPSQACHGRVYQWTERAFDTWLRAYEWTLRLAFRMRPAIMVASLVLIAATGYLFVVIPKGFIPSQDTGQLNGQTEAVQGIGFDSMVAHQLQVADIIQRDPNVLALTHNVNNGNTGRLNIELKPRRERQLTADDVIEELRPKLAAVPGIRVYLQNPPPIRIGGIQSRSLYQYTLQDPDTAELYRVAPQFEQRVRQLPGLVDVTSDLQITNPQVNVSLDRDRIAALGLTVDQVESALTSSYGSRRSRRSLRRTTNTRS